MSIDQTQTRRQLRRASGETLLLVRLFGPKRLRPALEAELDFRARNCRRVLRPARRAASLAA